MDIMVVARDPLAALSFEATLDLGGHKVVGRVHDAATALERAESDRPMLAVIHVEDGHFADLVGELRHDHSVPSLLIGAVEDCADVYRGSALGLLREPCGSRLILRAVKVADGLREGRMPRGRLPGQIEFFHRPERPGRRKCAARPPRPQTKLGLA
jgi:hypothetical protein